ncbi:MAG TPA: amidohydrolase family protein [Candidatus Binataceae bacterium]|nr:amidohydrolase family protein [Candidatus Binataceae bacterium]
MLAIDGDSHFIEPLDLFERYIDPPFRERALRVQRDPATGSRVIAVDGKPMRMGNVDQLLGAVVGYGEKEKGRQLDDFDAYLIGSEQWQDMDRRVRFLDEEGFEAQVIFPTMGILWQGDVHDPHLADALCRAYNTWAFEMCSSHKDRLFPAAHISLLDAQLAVREMERVARLGCRTIFVASAPVNGHSFGHPDLDPVWAAAQALDLSVGIHLVGHADYTGSQWYRDENPGFMFVTMNVIQDPRMALTTMVYDGVFERFPKLRAATIEAMAGWVGEWLERLDYRFKYMGHTSKMKRSASEYFARNIWISADPEERMLPLMVEFAGDDRFFVGSDYPHAEGFVRPVDKARERLARLSEVSVRKVLRDNAKVFYGI